MRCVFALMAPKMHCPDFACSWSLHLGTEARAGKHTGFKRSVTTQIAPPQSFKKILFLFSTFQTPPKSTRDVCKHRSLWDHRRAMFSYSRITFAYTLEWRLCVQTTWYNLEIDFREFKKNSKFFPNFSAHVKLAPYRPCRSEGILGVLRSHVDAVHIWVHRHFLMILSCSNELI